MSKSRLEEVKEFCEALWYSYLQDSNYQLLESIFDKRTSIIGTGKHEISQSLEEFKEKMAYESSQRDATFIIIDQWNEAVALSESLFLVYGEISCQEDTEDMLKYPLEFRYTIILEYKESWKVIHVHQSVADRYQQVDEIFPQQLMRESNRRLEEMIQKRTEELEKSHAQTIYLARYDGLTQLLNRQYMEKLVHEKIRDGKEGCLVLIDIDDFKQINDVYGHQKGDQVLIVVASALKSYFKQDIIGRIGGDEIMMFLQKDNHSNESFETLIEGFQTFWQKYQNHIQLDRPVTLSIGGVLFPQQARTYKLLYEYADKAMYRAKKSGKNQSFFY